MPSTGTKNPAVRDDCSHCQTVGQLYRWLHHNLTMLGWPADDHALSIMGAIDHQIHNLTELLRHDHDPLPEKALTQVQQIWQRLEQHEPLAYILGYTMFDGLRIRVTPDTLIPRPDSEILVFAALDRLPQDCASRVADLGTGTGALAIALAKARPHLHVLASDISPAALRVAERNVTDHHLQDRITLEKRDWLAGSTQRFAAIVANPPYIGAHEPHLKDPAIIHEPRLALVAEQNGLAAIKTIVNQAHHHLEAGGYLLLEHGYEQGANVRILLASVGYSHIDTLADLGGRERVTLGMVN